MVYWVCIACCMSLCISMPTPPVIPFFLVFSAGEFMHRYLPHVVSIWCVIFVSCVPIIFTLCILHCICRCVRMLCCARPPMFSVAMLKVRFSFCFFVRVFVFPIVVFGVFVLHRLYCVCVFLLFIVFLFLFFDLVFIVFLVFFISIFVFFWCFFIVRFAFFIFVYRVFVLCVVLSSFFCCVFVNSQALILCFGYFRFFHGLFIGLRLFSGYHFVISCAFICPLCLFILVRVIYYV